MSAPADANTPRKVVKSDAEWREQLDRTQYEVTRHDATERAFTGQFWDHWDNGVYKCVACGAPLLASVKEATVKPPRAIPSVSTPVTPAPAMTSSPASSCSLPDAKWTSAFVP